MSRGPGRVQRGLLRAIEDAYNDARPELWACIAELDLGLGEHPESRRRAAHQLEAAGLIELCTQLDVVSGPEDIFGPRPVSRKRLFARLPLGPASATYARHLREQWAADVRVFRDEAASAEARETAHKWALAYMHEASGYDFGVEQVEKHTRVNLQESSAARRLMPNPLE